MTILLRWPINILALWSVVAFPLGMIFAWWISGTIREDVAIATEYVGQ